MKTKLHFICILMSAATLTGRASGGQAGRLTWDMSEEGTLTIKGSGAMDDYEAGGTPWYPVRSYVKTIVLTDGVTTVGDYAFYNCTNATSVARWKVFTEENESSTMTNTVTAIGNYAFAGCTGLTSFTIPNSVTTIGGFAFAGCTGLTSVAISNSVITIGMWAFSRCDGLAAFTVESDNPSYSAVDGVLFNRDKTELVFYPIDRAVASYAIPNSVTAVGYGAFAYCSCLTSVTIPGSVRAIRNFAFHDCTGLRSLALPGSLTAVGSSAFAGCSGLTSVAIPGSVTAIGHHAFSGCTGVTSVFVSWSNPSAVECDSSIFDDRPAVTLYVPLGTKALYQAIAPWSLFWIVESPTANEPVPTNRLKASIHESLLTISGVKTGETVLLFDMNGRRLLTLRAVGETQTVSLAHLPRGVYIVRTAGESVKVGLGIMNYKL
jgi:Flp pilus assembly protein protease CpaA